MGTFSLLAGLAAPWAAGALVLALLLPRTVLPGHGLRAAGFGFLVGMAAVAWCLRLVDGVTGSFHPDWIIAACVGGAVLAGWSLHRRSDIDPEVAPGRAVTAGAPGAVRWLGAVLLGMAVLHGLFSAVEILVQPVFPWDGWTVWVYRAKAWFFAGEMAPIVSKQAWLAAESAVVYSTPALAYPLLPSLMPLWAALSLGAWHESLVNLPTLATGLAVALGLAGCVRGSGGGRLAAALAAYLLLSTPLFGVHMSLGGYGDLWMAAYAGLGMTAVLWGLLEGRRQGLVLGLVLLALATGVKAEGWVWLGLAAAVVLLASVRPRTLAALAGAAALMAGVAWLTGWTVIDTPGPGQIGYRDGHLYVPLKGIIRLERVDVGEAYLRNAFLMGNWHLLWVMVIAALVGLTLQARTRLARVAWAFFLPFALIQGAIFGLTTEGAWARDYTAVNRMPLQMLPAVIYLLVVTAQRGWTAARRSTRGNLSRAVIVGGVAGLALSFGGAVAWLSTDLGPEVKPRALGGDELRFVVGSGQRRADGIAIEGYQNGIALLSSGPVRIDPAAHNQLVVDIDAVIDPALPERAPAFFWRRADQPRDVSRLTLPGDGRYDLSRSPDWRGDIVELGFVFPDGGGAAATLHAARLEGRTLLNRLRLLPGQWTRFQTWTQRSAHFLWGGEPGQPLALTALVAAISVLGGLVGALLLGWRNAALPFTALLLAGWVLLDVRWAWDRLRQAELSLKGWRDMTMEERLAAGEPGAFHAYLARLQREGLGTDPARVVIVGDPRLEKYYALRAKYQLLPHSSIVSHRPPTADSLRTVDYVLFLGAFSDVDPAAALRESPAQRWRRLGLADRADLHEALELVDRDVQGTLFRVR